MELEFEKRKIGQDSNVFIIAELSANHNGSFDTAAKTLEAMKKSGADAVKLQTYTPDTMTIECTNDYFKINKGTLWDGKTLYELYKEAYMPWEWQPKLQKIARELDLICFSTPFDNSAVDFLEQMDVPLYKIASFEITDIPLIKYVASKGKPIIMSIGIAEFDEIQEAVHACREAGNNQLALLKCTSSYPAPVEEANLLTIPDIQKTFNVVPGLSDHTLGINISIASVALGAKIIERHFILDRKLGGPDASFSLEPEEFKKMVDGIREVEKGLGKVSYEISERTKPNREFVRSLFVVEDIQKGETFTGKNVRSIRPGFGLPPKYIDDIVGKKAVCDIKRGTPLQWEQIES